MREIYNRIFVMYPRGLRTGGPEAAHQLVATLRNLGQDAFLVPEPGSENKKRVPEFAHYDAPEVDAYEDSHLNAVVMLEVHVHMLHLVKKATRFCWWLSIDNSTMFRDERALNSSRQFRTLTTADSLRHSFNMLRIPYYWKTTNITDVKHVAQSSYAWAYLNTRFPEAPSILSDFTPSGEFPVNIRPSASRSRSVVYNPAKGMNLLRGVMEASPPDIDWVPIVDMSRAEVIETLSTSSIYLDMGHHPGKDRLPREAALAGALTLVARRGAGAFHSDVPIPWDHKINLGRSMWSLTAEKIEGMLTNLEYEVGRQNHYRRLIRTEESQFSNEVRDIFVSGLLGKDRTDYSLDNAASHNDAVTAGSDGPISIRNAKDVSIGSE